MCWLFPPIYNVSSFDEPGKRVYINSVALVGLNARLFKGVVNQVKTLIQLIFQRYCRDGEFVSCVISGFLNAEDRTPSGDCESKRLTGGNNADEGLST